MDGRLCQNKNNGDTVPKRCATFLMYSIYQYKKIATGAVQYCGLRVDYPSKKHFHQTVQWGMILNPKLTVFLRVELVQVVLQQ